MIKQYKFAICDDDIQFCNKIKSYIIFSISNSNILHIIAQNEKKVEYIV